MKGSGKQEQQDKDDILGKALQDQPAVMTDGRLWGQLWMEKNRDVTTLYGGRSA